MTNELTVDQRIKELEAAIAEKDRRIFELMVDNAAQKIAREMEQKRRRRKKATRRQRFSPCWWCQYPISHRHHLFPVEYYGENDATIQLCPNCHELYHIMFNAFVLNREKAQDMWARLYNHDLISLVEHADKVVELVQRVIKGEPASILKGQLRREPRARLIPINNN